jgi:aminoglycoside N3'-acetyltransferase
MEKLLNGDSIEVTGNLAKALVAKSWWRVKKSLGRDSVIGKQYS